MPDSISLKGCRICGRDCGGFTESTPGWCYCLHHRYAQLIFASALFLSTPQQLESSVELSAFRNAFDLRLNVTTSLIRDLLQPSISDLLSQFYGRQVVSPDQVISTSASAALLNCPPLSIIPSLTTKISGRYLSNTYVVTYVVQVIQQEV